MIWRRVLTTAAVLLAATFRLAPTRLNLSMQPVRAMEERPAEG